MPSSFKWLDYSEQDKRKMLEIISLFSEKTTRDELGIASIRDALADLFFPGTSTIQTRTRYFLFIPWIYQDLIKRKTPSSQIDSKLRQKEIELIDRLAKSEDTKGIIGIQSRAALKRLPSNIYWYGLRAWGIRLFLGSQEEYHRSLDSFIKDGDGWHKELPPIPSDFPENISFQLNQDEANYLAERLITQKPNSLLAFLVSHHKQFKCVNFAWHHPLYDEFPPRIQKPLRYAQNFSETIQGAALLYNLMLSEQKSAESWREKYQKTLQEWAEKLTERQEDLRRWDRQEFWKIFVNLGVSISPVTQRFIDRWLDFALNTEVARTMATHKEARRLIEERERFLKGSQARLNNSRALDLWQGESGTAQLDYRWGTAQRILSDLLGSFVGECDVAA